MKKFILHHIGWFRGETGSKKGIWVGKYGAGYTIQQRVQKFLQITDARTFVEEGQTSVQQ
jgi:hypothetical protein